MTKIDIFSGFLGAGKTTLIKKLIAEAYKGEQIVIIENEFGQIGIDGGFLKESGVQISEMNSGCICCSLVGDFGVALKKVIADFNPTRIIIEPSGVGKLSDVIKATEKVVSDTVKLNSFTAVIDATKCKIYLKNFKEFYENQIAYASTIVLSRTATIKKEKLDEAIALIREINREATIITTDWDKIDGKQIAETMEQKNTLSSVIAELEAELHEHHHDDECDDPDCECHHHHDDDDEHEHHHHHHHHDNDDDDDEHEHHHHHHHHDNDDDDDEHEHHHHHHDDDDDDEHEHHHHHDDDDECDDPDCECHHHHDGEHHHHHHHHADEVFESWGVETANKYSLDGIKSALEALADGEKYGFILRAKGIVPTDGGEWINFDYVPGESDVRYGSSDVTGKLCVIGSKINKTEIEKLFSIK